MRRTWCVASGVTLLWSAAALAAPGAVETSQAPAETPVIPAAPPATAPPPVVTPAAPAPADQGPDVLPPLEEPAPLSPPPSGGVRVVAGGETRKPRPVRAARRLALLGELGWNGLAGFGPILTFHAHPHLSVDLGAGLALVGAKLGARVRYNVLTTAVTPFVGAGIMAATGFDAPSRELGGGDNRNLNIEVRPSTFLQAVAGVDWTSSSGFTLVGALGYAWLIGRDNVVIVTGEPTAEERRAIQAAFRSSSVVTIALGYSFR